MPPTRLAPTLAAALLALGLAPACAANAAGDSSPPAFDAGIDAPAADAPVADDAPPGACQLSGDERGLDAVPAPPASQALFWDGARLAAVFQVQPSAYELRYAASDVRLAALGFTATFTEPLVDCGTAVYPCHAAPALASDGAGGTALVWSGYDPTHGAMALYFGRLDPTAGLRGFTVAVPGGADRPQATDLCRLDGGWAAVWQQAHAARFATLDAAGLGAAPEALSSPAMTAERPRVTCRGGAAWALYTAQTGADTRAVVFRARPAGGPFGPEVTLALAPLTRPRAVALLADPVGDGFLVVLDAEAPAGGGAGAAWLARVGADGAVVDGPRAVLAAAAGETLVIEAAAITPAGDVAVVGTSTTADAAHAVFQRVSRAGQPLHPRLDVSDGRPGIAGQPMGTLVAHLADRWVVSFVAGATGGAGGLYLRTVRCDF
ncbi:MAG TPA: hypothetical protein VGQ83_25200 [Polyangia bacterium]|jgi:hypothetical protein